MSYSFLKPVRIGNMVLKNRVIVPAMARYLCKDGYVTDAYVEYLRAIAEGGVAMVTVGIMPDRPQLAQHDAHAALPRR